MIIYLVLKRIIKESVDFQFEVATRKYTTLLQKEQDKNKRLLKSLEEHNIKDQILEKKERYMETPEETAKGEYEISDKETGQTYRFKSHIE